MEEAEHYLIYAKNIETNAYGENSELLAKIISNLGALYEA